MIDQTTVHARKVGRVHELMRRHDLQALLLMKNDNTRYLTGYQRYFCATYLPAVHAVLLPLDKEPILLLPQHIVRYGARCEAGEIVEFPMAQEAQVRLLAGMAADHGVDRGRIGVETDFMHVSYFQALQKELPGAVLADASPCLDEAVSVKFPEEVEVLRRAASVADRAVQEIFQAAKPGVTEFELAGIGAAALREGAEFLNHLCIRTGENAYELSPVNTSRQLRPGDPVQLDIGYIVEGYVSDINRTMIVGGPNREQEAIIRAVVKMERESIKVLRPGVRASDVFRRVEDVLDETGFRDAFNMAFVGHSIGVSLHENPYITKSNDLELQEGMVIAMEPGLYVPGQGTCRMEDMVVVTSEGTEFLTKCPDDLTLNGLA